MKKIKTIFLCSLVFVSSFLFFACQPKIKPTSIYFAQSEVSLFLGNTKYLYPEFEPSNANYYLLDWSSSDIDIATVNSRGKVTAKGYGEAIITATVKGTGIKADCKVVVNDGEMFKIFADDTYVKKEYYEGQTFNSDGLIIKGQYESGKTREIPAENYTISNSQPLTQQDNSITITYQTFSTTIEINVLPDYPLSLEVTNQPAKTTYYIGETFMPDGLELTLSYASGKTEVIEEYNYTTEKLTYNSSYIILAYKDLTATINITMQPTIIINDISKLQQAIDNAQDGCSIMIREGIYNTTTSITINSSKNIFIFGENSSTYLTAHNCPLFIINDDGTQGNITLARLSLSVSNNLYPPIFNPDNFEITMLEMIL